MTSRMAHIEWLTPEQGGRSAPPAGPRFVIPVRFAGVSQLGASGANWSLVLDRVAQPASGEWVARVQFLVQEAPEDLLQVGAQFELFEGNKCIAHGTVLDSASSVAMSISAAAKAAP
jgi:hypothetical protein